MFGEKPTLYFRRKGKGAAVYRIEESATSHLNLRQIATLKSNGEIKAQGKQEPTAEELDRIEEWKTSREKLGDGEASQIDTYITRINNMAQWLQSKATDEEVGSEAQDLLMAMHDLRSTIVRRLAGKSK